MRDKELIAAFGNGPRSNWREQILLPNFPPPVRGQDGRYQLASRELANRSRTPRALYVHIYTYVCTLVRGIEIPRCLTGGRHARWIHFSAKIDSRSSGPSGRHGTSMKFLQFGHRFETGVSLVALTGFDKMYSGNSRGEYLECRRAYISVL